jgi:hypothetical protein
MNSKQTDNIQDGKQQVQDWLSSSVRKTKLPKPVDGELEERFQDMLDEGLIKGRNTNGSATNEHENGSGTNDTIQEGNINNTMDSLQTDLTENILPTGSKRISGKQRKESLEEYRLAFLQVPKLEDRKPVFISREVRDRLDEIARKLGSRGMSVSGLIENLARHHLELYHEDVEAWKKL